MQKSYRMTVIFDTREQAESGEEMMKRLSDLMSSLGATINESKYLGVKDFARCASQKFTSGAYAEYQLSAPSSFCAEIKNRLSLDKTVNRVMIENI